MVRILYFILILTLFTYSCEKEFIALDALELPNGFKIDINEDGTDDYEVFYQQSMYSGLISGIAWSGRLRPLEDNAMLNNFASSDVNDRLATRGDVLSDDLPDELRWDNFRAGTSLIEIFSTGENPDRFPRSWTRSYDQASGPHFIGVRLAGDAMSSPDFGWIQFETDEATGRIVVLSSKLSAGSIVVGE